jgi:hypothetical protein
MPISGTLTNESSVHFGQVGQPRPEPVKRTAPPVTTIKISLISESQLYSRSRFGEKIAQERIDCAFQG